MEHSKKHFLKNMVSFSLVTWISFALGFLSSPIATRLFLPEELGRINQFHYVAALMSSLCFLGLDQAFVRFFRDPPGKSSTRSLFTFCTVTSLGFSLMSSLLLCFGWQGISQRVIGQPDKTIFFCLCLFSLCCVLFRYLALCYRMEQNPKLYTLQGVVHVVLTKLAYLSVGFGSAKGRTSILLLTLLMALFTLACIFFQRNRFDGHFAAKLDRPFFKEITAFSAPLIPITIVTTLNASINALVLGELEGFASIGIYTSALALASTVNLIQSGFNTYWAPYVYENYQNDNKSRFFTVHRIMACLLTFFGLTMTLLQTPLLLLLGEAYRGAAVFFPLLFLNPICYCLSETTGMGIGIAKKTYWNTVVFFTSVLVNLGLSYWLIPRLGATGAAVAAAGAAIVSLAFRTWAGERYYKAIQSYRYLYYAIFLLLSVSIGNVLLMHLPVLKYMLFFIALGLGSYLFKQELHTIWQTFLQVLKEGKSALTRLTKPADKGGANP